MVVLKKSIALIAVLGFAASACGGSDGDGASTDEPSATAAETDTETGDTTADSSDGDTGDETGEATGEPIKLMTVTTLNANGPTYENIAITANLAADYINENGGVNGRPIEVTVCDEQFDAAVAATCARQAVESGVVSVVGSFTYFAEAIVPVIAESDITWFGFCCSITPSELSNPYSFPIGNQPMYGVAEVKRAVEDGCENINAAIVDGGEAVFRPPMDNAMKAYGREFGEVVLTSAVPQDFSADVARVIDGADCVVTVMSETPYITWNTAWAQADTDDVRLYGIQGNLNAISAVGAEEATDGSIIGGMYPDITTAPWDEYRAALDAAGVDQEANDFNSLGGMGTWAGYMAFDQIASGIEGDVTARSFYDAANNTSNLDLGGMVPVIDFTQEWTDGLPGYNRLFNRSVVFSQLQNGEVVPLDNEFVDVTDLAMGVPQE